MAVVEYPAVAQMDSDGNEHCTIERAGRFLRLNAIECRLADTLHLPQEDKDQIFLRLVFNFVAGVSDDHNKNISFIMNQQGVWRLSPAYDVVFTANIWEDPSAHIHSMGVMGKRSAISVSDLLDFGDDFVKNPKEMILRVANAVAQFESICHSIGVDHAICRKIKKVINGLVTDDIHLFHSLK